MHSPIIRGRRSIWARWRFCRVGVYCWKRGGMSCQEASRVLCSGDPTVSVSWLYELSSWAWCRVVKNYGLSFILWAFSSFENLSLFWEILNWSANESKNPSIVRPITRGKVLEIPWSVRGRSAGGKVWEKVGNVLEDILVGSAKTDVCDCTKKKWY